MKSRSPDTITKVSTCGSVQMISTASTAILTSNRVLHALLLPLGKYMHEIDAEPIEVNLKLVQIFAAPVAVSVRDYNLAVFLGEPDKESGVELGGVLLATGIFEPEDEIFEIDEEGDVSGAVIVHIGPCSLLGAGFEEQNRMPKAPAGSVPSLCRRQGQSNQLNGRSRQCFRRAASEMGIGGCLSCRIAVASRRHLSQTTAYRVDHRRVHTAMSRHR